MKPAPQSMPSLLGFFYFGGIFEYFALRVLIGARMYRPRFARARYSASRFCRTYG
jgi:hypothetical protein